MISKTERLYIRDLAKKNLEISQLPVMQERKELWMKHNACCAQRPVIYTDVQCLHELLPPLKCTDPFARQLETQLMTNIIQHEYVDCDMVIPDRVRIPWQIDINEFGIKGNKHYAEDAEGRRIGFAIDYPIKDLRQDMHLLKPAKCSVDRKATKQYIERAQDILGDILPVEVVNRDIIWFPGLTGKIVSFMSMESMLLSIYDEPDLMKSLMEYITNNTIEVMQWFEKEGLLTFNNGNDYAGSGSLGFSDELPDKDYKPGMNPRLKDIWINTNSQETVGISPAMFKEFFYPYYYRIAQLGGLVYYGCCEPVHNIWKDCIENLPNLRKVSISKWCDEDIMGEALKDKRIIYCRKPDPNYIGVGKELDKEEFSKHILNTLKAAKGCEIEFSFRDIYTLCGNNYKLGEAVRIVRQLIDKFY